MRPVRRYRGTTLRRTTRDFGASGSPLPKKPAFRNLDEKDRKSTLPPSNE
jgi:hypothetical protein